MRHFISVIVLTIAFIQPLFAQEFTDFNAEGVGTTVVPGNPLDHPTWHLPTGVTLRLGKGTIGSSDRAVAFSPDGRYFAVSSAIGVWLYTVADPEHFILLPSGVVRSLSFSPDGKTLVSTGYRREEGEIRLWDVATGTSVANVEMDSWVSSAFFSPDGSTVVFRTAYPILVQVDAATGRQIAELHFDGSLGYLRAMSRDGTTLAFGAEDGTIRLWDVATRATTATLDGHRREIPSVTFAPDGRTLASASADGTVKLWDVASGAVSATIRGVTGQAACVAFSPDGGTLATGWTNRTVTLWDVSAGRTVATFNRHRDWLNAVSFSPDGRTLASSSEDGDVILWDLATGNATAISGHTEAVWGMAFSPDGSTLASRSGTKKGKVHIWDALTGLKTVTLGGHDRIVRSIAFAPDGTTLASASSDGTVRLWDLGTHSTIATLPHGFQLSSVSFSPDGNTLASGDFEGNVYLWDVKAEEIINIFTELGDNVRMLLFSPDGTALAAGTIEGDVRLWDVATGATKRIQEGQGQSSRVLSMAFSQDGTILAVGSNDDTVKLWDLAMGTASATLEARWADCVAFAPNGTMFATGTQEKLVRLYNMSTGDIIATFEGHNDNVTSVFFTPDGRTLASGSGDGTILLWDLLPYLGSDTPNPDFNGDGTIDFADFIQFAANFGLSAGDTGYNSRYDLDDDGEVGFSDFLIFAKNFGQQTESN